jgi:hypothetical protein
LNLIARCRLLLSLAVQVSVLADPFPMTVKA